ncbi:MAG: SIS domain-containing protein [Oscillospiraceae bacterium]|nr:SIS domain-containing protein [Oscillospiraceae bacterium]
MFDIDLAHYTEVVDKALALRSRIEEAVDKICEEGYSNIFFIGCGGTYAHSLPMLYWMESSSAKLDVYSVIAAEFMAMGHKKFSKDSICVFSTRSGNTKEIVAAAKFCKDAGARTLVYVSNDDTPVCEYADYKFYSPAEDPNLCEAIYAYSITVLARFMRNAGEFEKYDSLMDGMAKLTPYLIRAKEQYDPICEALAEKFKDIDYHMIVGGGMLWGEAYDYAMCILEEMQWIKTKSIHACEFFHGTLELVEEDTSVILFYGEDETRPLMDRVYRFVSKVSNQVTIFDTKTVELPFEDPEFRKILSPMIIYTITERLSAHIAKVRNHPLTVRRYYRQIEY